MKVKTLLMDKVACRHKLLSQSTNLVVIVVFVFAISYVITIPNIFYFNTQLKNWLILSTYSSAIMYDEEVAQNKTHAYIISTYYYPFSKSLGENAIGMILLMNRYTQKNMTQYRMKLIATDAFNNSATVMPKFLEESYSNCPYILLIGMANVLPNLTKLEIFDGNVKTEIPFRLGRTTAPAPVIICISPQFVAEQWQLFVAHAHVARRFGGHLHIYITSMIDSFFDLVQEYEKLGYVTLDFWMRLKFANATDDAVEPNIFAELRNQAGAESDCLYQYKEAAAFITFFDLDDIFFPRGFDSYYDEFTALYDLNPNILTFQYTKREMMTFNKARIEDTNFEEMFGHNWFVHEYDYGKVMTRPENLNSMWIHQSWNIPTDRHNISFTNFIIHLQKPVDPDGNDPVYYRQSRFGILESMKINSSILKPIQEEFDKMLNSTNILLFANKLQTKTYYYRIIYRCYYEKFYKAPKKDSCPNGEGCLIPQRSDLNCVHADADFKSGPQMWPITYHYHINSRWIRTKGCLP